MVVVKIKKQCKCKKRNLENQVSLKSKKSTMKNKKYQQDTLKKIYH